MKSRMFANGSPLPERSARRSATVTISVPLATSASRINSFEANLPVPTSSREVNSRSAIFSLEGLSDIAATYHKVGSNRAVIPNETARDSVRIRATRVIEGHRDAQDEFAVRVDDAIAP